MVPDRAPDRRRVLAGGAAAITSVALTSASAAASPAAAEVAGGPTLRLHLDAGNPASYDPTAAGTWNDLSGTGNHVTVPGGTGSPTFDAGGWFAFDGGDFLELGALLAAGTAYTLEAWVRDAGPGGVNRNILSSAQDVLFISGSTLYGGTGGSYLLTSSPSFPQGAWKHVAYTLDPGSPGTARLLIDGAEVATTSTSRTFSGGTLRLGSHESGGSPVSFWNGRIAQVRVYSGAPSTATLLANYEATRGTFGV